MEIVNRRNQAKISLMALLVEGKRLEAASRELFVK
jgi:hypothetical protein